MNEYIVTIYSPSYCSKISLEVESDYETEAEVQEDIKSLFPQAPHVDARIKAKRTF